MVRALRNTKNLFFIKRLPKLHVPYEWKKHQHERDYQLVVNNEGFISPVLWQDHDINKYPTLKQDLADLDEYLLPAFFEFNQKALHYQNRFYLYQWVFMGGAFVTTLFGALTTYAYTLSEDGGMAATVFGISTAIVSGLTAYFNILSEQNSPQRRWAKSRRLAEELRMNYFRYLAHLEPFEKEDRVQQMRRLIIDVRRKENENG